MFITVITKALYLSITRWSYTRIPAILFDNNSIITINSSNIFSWNGVVKLTVKQTLPTTKQNRGHVCCNTGKASSLRTWISPIGPQITDITNKKITNDWRRWRGPLYELTRQCIIVVTSRVSERCCCCVGRTRALNCRSGACLWAKLLAGAVTHSAPPPKPLKIHPLGWGGR
jgi:hypothetical protein